MTDALNFVESFLSHAYDPVRAHEYYIRTRQLKGRVSAQVKAGAKAFETHQVSDAQKKLNSDLKKAPPVKLNKARRIGAAEQKLIRAKSLASRIKDPTVKADMLARLASVEKKIAKVKGSPLHTTPDKAGRKPGDPHYGEDPPANKSQTSSKGAKSTTHIKGRSRGIKR